MTGTTSILAYLTAGLGEMLASLSGKSMMVPLITALAYPTISIIGNSSIYAKLTTQFESSYQLIKS
jgi:hypothetical protein